MDVRQEDVFGRWEGALGSGMVLREYVLIL